LKISSPFPWRHDLGGLQAGSKRKHFNQGSVNRILLLRRSGQCGNCRPDQISLVARQIRENSISVSSLGVGIDYNENLMANIADNSGGSTTTLATLPAWPKSSTKVELVQSVIGTNVVASLKLADGVQAVDVAGFQWIQTDELAIQVPDVYAGETKRILVHLRAASAQKTALGKGSLTLSISRQGTESRESGLFPSVESLMTGRWWKNQDPFVTLK
jgi:Ca-activated chloride channel family protein